MLLLVFLLASATSTPVSSPFYEDSNECDGFKCKNGVCIDATARCDEVQDCPDGDDELQCEQREPACPQGTFLCDDHSACIPRKWFCDEESDCEDDSDEANCQTTTSHPEPSSCEMHGQNCSQYCANSQDGYSCSCASGYQLSSDKHTCHPQEEDENATIYVSIQTGILSISMHNLENSSTSPFNTRIRMDNGYRAKSLALDVKGNRLLAVIENVRERRGVITSIMGDRTLNIRENIIGIHAVAVDWIGRNILFTARTPSHIPVIDICTLNGIFCKRIITAEKLEYALHHYSGLSVNPLAGLVAWIESSDENHKMQRIMVANLDGSSIRTVVDHKLSRPIGLAFDVFKNDLYFSENRNRIERVNVDSGKRSVVIDRAHWPHHIEYFDNRLYWTEWLTSSVKMASLRAEHSRIHLVESFTRLPQGIALNHSLAQPPLDNNPCDDFACPWLCVAVRADDSDSSSELEARCVCPDEYEENVDYGETGGLPCKLRESRNETKEASHVPLAAMKEYCREGQVCGKGGHCVEQENKRGEAVRIMCICEEGYSGLMCELPPPRLEPQQEQSIFAAITAVVFILVLIIVAAGFVIFRRQRESIDSNTSAFDTVELTTRKASEESELVE